MRMKKSKFLNTYLIFEEKTECQMDSDLAFVFADLRFELQCCFDDINWSHVEGWRDWGFGLVSLCRLLTWLDLFDPSRLILILLSLARLLFSFFLLCFDLFLQDLGCY